MAKRWHIQGYDGHEDTFDSWAPARLSERQVMQLLARLHCRHLSEAEVIAATVASAGRDRVSEMVVRNNGRRGGFMTTGSSEHYTAAYEDPDA